MTQDSKAEYRIEVETPPRSLPQIITGNIGIRMQRHEIVYVTQNTMHIRFLPLTSENIQYSNSDSINDDRFSTWSHSMGVPHTYALPRGHAVTQTRKRQNKLTNGLPTHQLEER